MNIHKHLRNLFLVSTALFWANCSSDSDVSSPATTAEGQSSSQDSIESSSSVGNSSEQASSEENNTESSSSETSTKQSSSSEELRKYTLINDFNNYEFLPDSCEPNRYGIIPGREYFIEFFANTIGQSRIEEILSDSSAFADSAAQETRECLNSVLDTISYFPLLYGASPKAVLDVKCSDGSTYFSQVVKKYAEQNNITEEEAFQVSEQYDKGVEERLKKIKQQIDGCLQTETEPFEYHCISNIADNSKEECDIEKMPYKEVTLGISTCYGKTEKNDSGEDVEKITCDNGEEWQRPLK